MPNEQPDQLSIDDSGPRVRLAVPAMTRVLALLVALIPTVMLTLAEDQFAAKQVRGTRFIRCGAADPKAKPLD